MAEEQCTMYFRHEANLNLDKTFNLLQNKGLFIEDRKTKIINALDEKGDLYQTNYNEIVNRIIKKKSVHLVIQLSKYQSNIF